MSDELEVLVVSSQKGQGLMFPKVLLLRIYTLNNLNILNWVLIGHLISYNIN